MANKELQEKLLAYRILESRLNGLIKQSDFIANKIMEIETTLTSMDEIEKSKESILFPIGSEAYTFGKVVNEKMIVEIGANVALEKSIEEGKEVLNKRKGEMENILDSLQKNISEISYRLEQLGPELQEIASEEQSAG